MECQGDCVGVSLILDINLAQRVCKQCYASVLESRFAFHKIIRAENPVPLVQYASLCMVERAFGSHHEATQIPTLVRSW